MSLIDLIALWSFRAWVVVDVLDELDLSPLM
jgi:hypothetical protein